MFNYEFQLKHISSHQTKTEIAVSKILRRKENKEPDTVDNKNVK